MWATNERGSSRKELSLSELIKFRGYITLDVLHEGNESSGGYCDYSVAAQERVAKCSELHVRTSKAQTH